MFELFQPTHLLFILLVALGVVRPAGAVSTIVGHATILTTSNAKPPKTHWSYAATLDLHKDRRRTMIEPTTTRSTAAENPR